MAAETYTELTSQSWLSRIGGAFKGILIGVVLMAVAFVLLFWNEGRAVKTYKTLKEGGKTVVPVSAEAVDAANDGKLIHLSGMATTDATVKDPVFGVSAEALKLIRSAEMYQWRENEKREEKKKLGGGTETSTTYTYEETWSSSLIPSKNFNQSQKYQNPTRMAYASETFVASPVTLGAFTLSASLIGKISGGDPITPDSLPDALAGKAQLAGGTVYIGANSSSPAIGDIRVRFSMVKPQDVSVMSRQQGSSFTAHQTKAGGTINLLRQGLVSADDMIAKAQDDNRTLTWILRFVGWLVMCIGLAMIFKPLSVIADVLPILGNIVEAGTGLIATLLSTVFSLCTIAVAWIVFRPLLGVGLLVVAIAIGVFAGQRVNAAKTAT